MGLTVHYPTISPISQQYNVKVCEIISQVLLMAKAFHSNLAFAKFFGNMIDFHMYNPSGVGCADGTVQVSGLTTEINARMKAGLTFGHGLTIINMLAQAVPLKLKFSQNSRISTVL